MSLEEINGRIQDLYQEWSSLSPLSQENEDRLWKKIRLEWNYNSNRIEGNTLTYSETELLFLYGHTEGSHPFRDYVEMEAHNVGIEKVREFAEDKERCLTEADIRGLNLIILKEPFRKKAKTPGGQLTWKEVVPGRYKTQPNHVETPTGEIFKFALPEEVPAKMEELIKWFNGKIESPPTSIASFLAELHYRFIFIHPFDDGNGRIVRLWINYALIRFGYPPLVIKSEDKEGYIAALQKADIGDIEALAIYLGKSLISWLEIGIKAGRGEDISAPEDIDKEIDIFIKGEKVKGLKDVKPLSRRDIEEIYEQFWITLFEVFKNQFEQFNELFYSSKVSFKPTNYERVFSGYGLEEKLKEYIRSWGRGEEDRPFGLEVSYESYRASESFAMKAELLIKKRPNDFEYGIRIKAEPSDLTASKERKNMRVWTDSEIREFIAEGKKDFLEVLRKMTEKTADKKG